MFGAEAMTSLFYPPTVYLLGVAEVLTAVLGIGLNTQYLYIRTLLLYHE